MSIGLLLPTMGLFFYELFLIHKLRLALRAINLLLGVMILADVCWIASQGFLYHTFASGTMDLRIVFLIFFMTSLACVSLSHWLFSFNYWVVSQRVKMILLHINPKSRENRWRVTNISVTILNILVPMLYGWTFTS